MHCRGERTPVKEKATACTASGRVSEKEECTPKTYTPLFLSVDSSNDSFTDSLNESFLYFKYHTITRLLPTSRFFHRFTCISQKKAVPLHAKCAKRISTTHGKTDTHSHHHHRCMRGTAVRADHTAKKWEVQQRTHLTKQANETRPYSLRYFARQRNTQQSTQETTSKTIITYEQQTHFQHITH